MNTQEKLNMFDQAIAVMAQAATLMARADELTLYCSAFKDFEDLLTAKGDYRPSLNRRDPECRELGALYDAAQQQRGDSRRAFMYGTPARKGSLIDRGNYDATENWYAQGSRRTWWDRYTRQWIAYTVCERGYQEGSADFYPNSASLLMGEHCHA